MRARTCILRSPPVDAFAIGGIGAVLYNLVKGASEQPFPLEERMHRRHRYTRPVLASPFLFFAVAYFFPWNPHLPGHCGQVRGAPATMLCRPDLKNKMWAGGALFLLFYVVFLQGLEWMAPGYIERVWNLEALSGIRVFGMPLEELLFAVGFGLYGSGVYEHVTWHGLGGGPRAARESGAPACGG